MRPRPSGSYRPYSRIIIRAGGGVVNDMTDRDEQNWIRQQVRAERREIAEHARRLSAERRAERHQLMSAERRRLSAERRRVASDRREMRRRQLIQQRLAAPTSREPHYSDEHPRPALTVAQRVYGTSPRPGRGWYKSPESSTEEALMNAEYRAAMAAQSPEQRAVWRARARQDQLRAQWNARHPEARDRALLARFREFAGF
jgi:hypothetical protein